MPSKDTQGALATIAHNIVLVKQFLGELSPEAFADNVMAVYAVTRCLEIISEFRRRETPGNTCMTDCTARSVPTSRS